MLKMRLDVLVAMMWSMGVKGHLLQVTLAPHLEHSCPFWVFNVTSHPRLLTSYSSLHLELAGQTLYLLLCPLLGQNAR